MSAVRDERLARLERLGAGLTWRPPIDAAVVIGGAIALLGAALLLGRSSAIALVAIGTALAVLMAVASLRWPRTVIVLVVLTPILDRYIIADWFPANVSRLAHFMSEGFLLAVSVALGIQAWRRGTLVPALRHPVSIGLVVFVAIAIISALVNAVPPHVAIVGLGFTLDAVACFYLPRLVGFSVRQSLLAVAPIFVLVFLSALGGLAQWIITPNFLGLVAWQGVYGEVYRLASIYSDPNTFGALLIAMIPFAAFGITSLERPWHRFVAFIVVICLFMPLYLSFSRGAWGGLIVGGGLLVALISWRTLLIAAGIAAISFMMAITVPRMVAYQAPPGPDPVQPVPEAPATPPPQPSLVDSTIARIAEIWLGKDLRTLLVLNGLPIVADHPILGVGPGRYGGAAADIFPSPVYEKYGTDDLIAGSSEQTTVDNFWLHILIETGVLGVMAFIAAGLAGLIGVFRAARHSRGWTRVLLAGTAAGVAAMAANSVTTMLLEANSVAFFVWFLLGLGSVAVASMAAKTAAAGRLVVEDGQSPTR